MQLDTGNKIIVVFNDTNIAFVSALAHSHGYTNKAVLWTISHVPRMVMSPKGVAIAGLTFVSTILAVLTILRARETRNVCVMNTPFLNNVKIIKQIQSMPSGYEEASLSNPVKILSRLVST